MHSFSKKHFLLTHSFTKIQSVLINSLVILSIIMLFAVSLSAAQQVLTNYHVHWFEYDSLIQVKDILAGNKIYREPTMEYVPLIYGPLFFYLAAGFAQIMGAVYGSLRMVSLLSSIGTMAVLFLCIRRYSKNIFAAVIGLGIYATAHITLGNIFIIARVDPLQTFLLMSALYVVGLPLKPLRVFIVGLLLTGAFFTKLTTIIAIIIIGGYYLLSNKRAFLLYFTTVFLLILVNTAILTWYFSGWFGYYTYILPAKHTLEPILSLRFILIMITLFPILPFIFYLTIRFTKDTNLRIHPYHHLFLIILTTATISFLGLSNQASGDNVLLPIYFTCALIYALAVSKKSWPFSPDNPVIHAFINSYITLFFLAQFLWIMWYAHPISTSLNVQNARQNTRNAFFSTIQKTNGDVYTLNYQDIAAEHNTGRYANFNALCELFGCYGDHVYTKEGRVLREKFEELIRKKHFGALIFSHYYLVPKNNPLTPEIMRYYKITSTISQGTEKSSDYVILTPLDD